jgi:hypothetical protein
VTQTRAAWRRDLGRQRPSGLAVPGPANGSGSSHKGKRYKIEPVLNIKRVAVGARISFPVEGIHFDMNEEGLKRHIKACLAIGVAIKGEDTVIGRARSDGPESPSSR